RRRPAHAARARRRAGARGARRTADRCGRGGAGAARPRPGAGAGRPSPRVRPSRRTRRARPPHGARLPGARRLMRVALLLAGPPGPRVGRLLSDLWLTGRLWRLVAREPIDVVHAHNYEAAIAGLVVARLTGRPLVYHGHSALAEELPLYFTNPLVRRLAARLGRSLDAQVPRRADFCIAVTDELGALLRRRGVTAAGLACIGPAGTPEELGPPPAPGGDGG